MKLADYPQAIAAIEKHLLGITKKVRAAQAEIEDLEAAIETEIARDKSLSNDALRKARRAELRDNNLYKECLKELQYQQDNRSAVEIELRLIVNQFSVAKLQLRESIAFREAQATIAA